MQSKHLVGLQIISLHTGQLVGELGSPIINPHSLSLAAFRCKTRWQKKRQEDLILLTQDIRQVASGRVLINSVDEIRPVSDLVRLQEVIKIDFSLIDKPVRNESKRRLGKVDDYVVNPQDFWIQKIYVRQPFLKNLAVHSLVIDRQQIIEVSDRFILVNDATAAQPAVVPQQAA